MKCEHFNGETASRLDEDLASALHIRGTAASYSTWLAHLY